jgi:hypothetical protein
VPLYNARRYLCAIVEAVAWLDAGPTDAFGALSCELSDSFVDTVFIPAPSNPHLGGCTVPRNTARKCLRTLPLRLDKAVGKRLVDEDRSRNDSVGLVEPNIGFGR